MILGETKIETLTRVGKSTAQKLKKLSIHTARDLLFYFPFRYDDYSKVSEIQGLIPDTKATVKGKIELMSNRRSPRKHTILTEAIISDASGSIKSLWFHQPFLTQMYKPGDEVYLSGKLEYDYHQLFFMNPVIERSKKYTLHTARIVPIYPLTENLTQKQVRFLVGQALTALPSIIDWLPSPIKKNLQLPSLSWSIREAHFPQNYSNLASAQRRLKFDELFLLQLKILITKKSIQKENAPMIHFQNDITQAFVSSLHFTLTNDQKKVAWQIIKDLSRGRPMNRLIEGDVGSGKTVVVALALLNVACNKYQSVFMAPTEILARQHYQTFLKYFLSMKLTVALLTGSESQINNQKVSRQKLCKSVKKGDIDILVGTHALIVKKKIGSSMSYQVSFKNLGFVVVDEQHRFGVEQRRSLKDVSGNPSFSPHFLSMSATPIPRTLSLIFYGDLSLSKIIEMPKGRKNIITKIIPLQEQGDIYKFVKNEISSGRQAYIICPIIDPSDILGVKSVTAEYERLKRDVFPDLSLGYLHGRMKSLEKERVMKNFLEGKIDILLSTSVVEVGIDVPNASVMIIEGAQRFGLSQLYQFRGRIGRGAYQSHCFLFVDKVSDAALKRIHAFMKAKNCFELAELDLALRGPGDILGIHQSGFSDLHIAKLEDWQLASDAKAAIEEFLEDPIDIQKYPLLYDKIKNELRLAHLE